MPIRAGSFLTGAGTKMLSDYGCIFSINPDAHSIKELDHMHWGVEMACKGGGVPPERVLNAMPLASSSAIFNAGDKPRRSHAA